MTRIIIKTFYLDTGCKCELRVEQWEDERKKEYGVMVVGKPCAAAICDGRKQAATIKRFLLKQGGIETVDGQLVH